MDVRCLLPSGFVEVMFLIAIIDVFTTLLSIGALLVWIDINTFGSLFSHQRHRTFKEKLFMENRGVDTPGIVSVITFCF